jgi:NADPH-dependent 2,4-dienoyl-CoA reductase/sulfur reductase-like enzyme
LVERRCELLVIGAGPAGMAAAATAAGAGVSVAVYDMQAEPGGQIWRGEWRRRRNPLARRWCEALERSGAALHMGARLLSVDGRSALFDRGAQAESVRFERAVVATGARELLLPFPGWTLPGVFGAGGLQALAKNGWPVRGKRVVVAGTGPLLLACAATLREKGADVLCIAEQTSRSDLVAFAPAVLRTRGKVVQSLGLLRHLGGVAYRAATWVAAAHGDERLRSVTLRDARGGRQVDCDYLAVGFGLVPNLEVAQAFGCALRDGAVATDADQHTGVPGVYCVGEGTGIGGVEQALAQGEIAGLAIARRSDEASGQRARLRAARRFASALARRFALREEVLRLADDGTLLCRCEDVPLGAVRACASVREAKLHTRMGMGHCQGRICGAAAGALFGWAPPAARLPLAPTSVRHLNFSEVSTNQESCTT